MPDQRTLASDLSTLETMLRTLPRQPAPGRVELSVEGATVVAQVMHDRLQIPVVGTGAHISDALHDLRVEVEDLAKRGRQRRAR